MSTLTIFEVETRGEIVRRYLSEAEAQTFCDGFNLNPSLPPVATYTATEYTPSAVPVDTLDVRQRKESAERLRGLLTMECNGSFRPKNPRSQPAGTIGSNLSKEVAMEFAITFNESSYSVRKSRWAVVTTGGALLLLPCDPDHRPPSPWMFHPAVRELPDCSNEDAQVLAEQENGIRFEQSVVPRNWTVPVVSLLAVWLKREARRNAGAELQTA